MSWWSRLRARVEGPADEPRGESLIPLPDAGGPEAPDDLVTLDLEPLPQWGNRWAAVAAVIAATTGNESGVHAVEGDWYYDDGGGNWAFLYRFADGRAVLIGSDHEYSQTYFGPAAEYFGEPETDLLAGAPDWWAQAVAEHDPSRGEWISWVYGWDGRRWQRAGYALPDGFLQLALPVVTEEAARKSVRESVEYHGPLPSPGGDHAIAQLLAAGAGLSTDQLLALGPAAAAHADLGVAVARAFAEPGRH